MIGKSLFDLLPENEDRAADQQYALCVSSGRTIRFNETFSTSGKPVQWDTTLQYVPLDAGRDRVVGTAISVPVQTARVPDRTLEDIQYFSSMADMQLENFLTMFDQASVDPVFGGGGEFRLARLSGMCRTVQQAVADIRNVVRKVDTPLPRETGRAASRPQKAENTDTLRALYEFSVADMPGTERRGAPFFSTCYERMQSTENP